MVAVGITSAPEANGAGADTAADARHSSPQASLNSPPVPERDELNRRGWDLLKRAEGWMLDPPRLKPGSTSEASLPGFDAEAHGMRVHLEVQQMAMLLVTDGPGKDVYAGSTLIAEVRRTLTQDLTLTLTLILTAHHSPLTTHRSPSPQAPG